MSSLPALPESDDNLAIFGARSRVGKAEEDGVAESENRDHDYSLILLQRTRFLRNSAFYSY